MENGDFETGSLLPHWVKGSGQSEITDVNPADGNYSCHIASLAGPTEGSINQDIFNDGRDIWVIKARTSGPDYVRRNWDGLWGVKLTEAPEHGEDVLDNVISPETKMSEGWVSYAVRALNVHGDAEFKIYSPNWDLNVDTIESEGSLMEHRKAFSGQLPAHPNQAITIERQGTSEWEGKCGAQSDSNGSYYCEYQENEFFALMGNYRIKADGAIIIPSTWLSWLDFRFVAAYPNVLHVARTWDYRTREGVRFAGNVEEAGTVKIYKQNGEYWDEIGEGTADIDGNYILPASGHCELWNQWTKEGIYRIYLNDVKVGTELFNISDFSFDTYDGAFCKFSIPEFNKTIPSGDQEGIALFGNLGIEGEAIKITKDNNGAWWVVGNVVSDLVGDYRVPIEDWRLLLTGEAKADNYRLYINEILFDEKFIADGEWAEEP